MAKDDSDRDMDTLPPPDGGDAYGAETVVRTVSPELLAVMKDAPHAHPRKPVALPPPRPREQVVLPASGIPKVSDELDDADADGQLPSKPDTPLPVTATERGLAENSSLAAPPPKASGWFDFEVVVVFILALVAVLAVGLMAMGRLG